MGFTETHRTEQKLEMEFDRLYRENEKKVFSLAWRLTGDEEAAKDIGQKTFLTLHKKLKEVLKHPAPGGWLIQTMHYFVLNHKRELAYRARHEVSLELAERVEATPPTDEIESFQARLPSWVKGPERKILTLYYCYGYSLREISGMVGLTYDATKARMSRIHTKLREYGFDEPDEFD